MRRDQVRYEERTGWPAWVTLIVIGSLGAAAAALFSDSGISRVAAVLVLSLFAVSACLFWILFGRFQVQITSSDLVVGFGFVRLIRKRIPFDEIVRAEPVDYRPIREFGGWGIRFGRDGKRAWTIRGNRAVRLELRSGRLVYVGSEMPERLAARLRSAGVGRSADGETRHR